MSTIKSSTEHLTLNADGSGKDIKFQANGVEKASISSAGAFTSTSIDATKLSGALPAIDGSALTGMPAGGKVLQMKSNVYDGAASFALPSSYAGTGYSMTGWQYTNVSLTLTPEQTTSTFYISSTVNFASSNHSERISFKIVREVGGTIYTPTGMGAIDGNRRMCNASTLYLSTGSDEHLNEISMQTFDYPNTTSSVTYKLYVNQNASGITFFINRPHNNGNASYIPKASSVITAVEVTP